MVSHIDQYSEELFGEIDGVFSNFGSASNFAKKIVGDIEIREFELDNPDKEANTVYHRWWNL